MGPLPRSSESLTVLPPAAGSVKSGAFCPTSSAGATVTSPRVKTIAATPARIRARLGIDIPPITTITPWSARHEAILARRSRTPVTGNPVRLVKAPLHDLLRVVPRYPDSVGVVVPRHPRAGRRPLRHPLIGPVTRHPGSVARRRIRAAAVAIGQIGVPGI